MMFFKIILLHSNIEIYLFLFWFQGFIYLDDQRNPYPHEPDHNANWPLEQ